MARAPLRRRRVLVVDDDPVTVDWLRMVVEQAQVEPPFEVRSASLGTGRRGHLRRVAARDRPARPAAARRRRPRRAEAHEGARPRHRGDRHQRPGHHRPGARCRAGRRLLLRREVAARSRRPGQHPRAGRPSGRRAGHARGAAGQAARSRRHGRHRRPEPGDARAVRAGRRGGAEQRQRAHPGRERHRQGADRQRPPPAQPARPGAVHQDQLRGHPQGPDRVGAVRLQEGRLHRRQHRQGRPVRAGRGRRADARRDRRDAGLPADQAAAGAAGARVPADRQRSLRQGGLPADLRHQRRPRCGAARRPAARGPLLPHQHHRRCGCRRCASAPRTSRCCRTGSSRSSPAATRRRSAGSAQPPITC